MIGIIKSNNSELNKYYSDRLKKMEKNSWEEEYLNVMNNYSYLPTYNEETITKDNMSKEVKHTELMLSDNKIDIWLKSKKNILLIGEHGVGKTSIIHSAFKRNFGKINEDWVMLSGANLDPWTDLIGIPKVREDEDGNSYIDFVRPQNINPNIKAIFIDELNRAKAPVRNAVMELIQFKSINSREFPNLEVVCAAINPEDTEEDDDLVYDVERLDPAQKDRFHIIVRIPYKPDRKYFKNRFGETIGEQAVSWWMQQAKGIQKAISPRRLEYGIECYLEGIALVEVFGNVPTIKNLITMLSATPNKIKLASILSNKSQDNLLKELKQFLSDENIYEEVIEEFLSNKENLKYIEAISEEKLSLLLTQREDIKSYIIKEYITSNKFKDIIDPLVNLDEDLKHGIQNINNAIESVNIKIPLMDTREVGQLWMMLSDTQIKNFKHERDVLNDHDIEIKSIISQDIQTTINRKRCLEVIYDLLEEHMYSLTDDDYCLLINKVKEILSRSQAITIKDYSRLKNKNKPLVAINTLIAIADVLDLKAIRLDKEWKSIYNKISYFINPNNNARYKYIFKHVDFNNQEPIKLSENLGSLGEAVIKLDPRSASEMYINWDLVNEDNTNTITI